MSEEKVEREKIFLAYMGERWDYQAKKTSKWWIEVVEEGEEFLQTVGKVRCFSKPIPGSHYVGAVYSLECHRLENDGLTVYTSTAKYAGTFKGEVLVEWRALHDSAKTQAQLESNKRKDASYNALRVHLHPIKEAMGKTNREGRRAIVAVVLDELFQG